MNDLDELRNRLWHEKRRRDLLAGRNDAPMGVPVRVAVNPDAVPVHESAPTQGTESGRERVLARGTSSDGTGPQTAPKSNEFSGGRYWDRTSDLRHVKAADGDDSGE